MNMIRAVLFAAVLGLVAAKAPSFDTNTPTTVRTIRGSEVNLPCTINDITVSVKWNKTTGPGEFKVLSDPDVDYKKRRDEFDPHYSILYYSAIKTYYLTVKDAVEADEGTYYCYFEQDGVHYSRAVTLQVLEPSEDILWNPSGFCGKQMQYTKFNRTLTISTPCDALGATPCCDHMGQCGFTTDDCDCPTCVDSRKVDPTEDFCKKVNLFECGNGNCVSVMQRCDGTDDCGDNSDETPCEVTGNFYDGYFDREPKETAGEQLSLNCEYENLGPGENVTWRRVSDERTVPNANTSHISIDQYMAFSAEVKKLIFNPLKESDAGDYVCEIASDKGVIRSAYKVSVRDPNFPKFSQDSPDVHRAVVTHNTDIPCSIVNRQPEWVTWTFDDRYGYTVYLKNDTAPIDNRISSYEKNGVQYLRIIDVRSYDAKKYTCNFGAEDERFEKDIELTVLNSTEGIKWSPSGRCGSKYDYKIGETITTECDRLGAYPCCDRVDFCSFQQEDCECNGCTDYRKAEKTECDVTEFTCNNGDCVKGAKRCDKYGDCYDDSDEAFCDCYGDSTKFQCGDGTTCIDRTKVCDCTSDCSDGSDELNCFNCAVQAKNLSCEAPFQLVSAKCILSTVTPMSWVEAHAFCRERRAYLASFEPLDELVRFLRVADGAGIANGSFPAWVGLWADKSTGANEPQWRWSNAPGVESLFRQSSVGHCGFLASATDGSVSLSTDCGTKNNAFCERPPIES